MNANSSRKTHTPNNEKCSFVSYINIDSGKRMKENSNIYGKLYNLPPYPIHFTNGSSILTIDLPNHPFEINDRIVLNNVISKNVILKNVLSVKKNSFFVRIYHQNHGLSLYGLYNQSDENEFIKIEYVDDLPSLFSESNDIPDTINQYYILKKNSNIDFNIQLSYIKGNDITGTLIGNIPVNFLNRKQKVYLLFTKNNNIFSHDSNSYLVMLEKKSAINYRDGQNYLKDKFGNPTNIITNNTTYIKYFNLFGIPINYINFGTPKNKYATIVDKTDNNFSIDVGYNAIVDPNNSFYNHNDNTDPDIDISGLVGSNKGGGSQIFVRKILETIAGYPNPNFYAIPLERTYQNIIQAKIVGSIFPNSQRTINDQETDIINNRLYWRNLDDGEYIYCLTIKPGNYPPNQLAHCIEEAFSNTLRYQYSQEYNCGINPTIITQPTPLNSAIYDENGYYKYHIVDVSISDITDIVSFSSFREILQHDGSNGNNIIMVPDNNIEFTMAENLKINLGTDGSGILPFKYTPFDPESGEILYIYFTANSHIRIDKIFPNMYNYLYRYTKHLINIRDYTDLCNKILAGDENEIDESNIKINGYNTFLAEREKSRAILINFYRTKGIYPDIESTQEINSINTSTLLENFNYNHLTNEVYKVNHFLTQDDLIITDQFIDPSSLNQIFVYEISQIIGPDKFIVKKYGHGQKYKFIYDSLIINFNSDENPHDTVYWLDLRKRDRPVDHAFSEPRDSKSQSDLELEDQILMEDPITTLSENSEGGEIYGKNNNTISFVNIEPRAENKNMMYVYHPNHQLLPGTNITISNSHSINQVPSNIINQKHTINRILDNNYYEILLDKYTPILGATNSGIPNTVSIRYPDIFQMFFNYPDTLGNILGFDKVGHDVAITQYRHTIRNTDDYSPNNQHNPKKLEMTGPNYFYICSPELGHYHNTKPVQNVFSIVRWFDEPGNVVFDSADSTAKIFNPPLAKLSELHFTINHPDGRLVEFNGLDHQFTIEIIEERNQLVNT